MDKVEERMIRGQGVCVCVGICGLPDCMGAL